MNKAPKKEMFSSFNVIGDIVTAKPVAAKIIDQIMGNPPGTSHENIATTLGAALIMTGKTHIYPDLIKKLNNCM